MTGFFESALKRWPILSRLLIGILILIGFVIYLYLEEISSRIIGGLVFALIIAGIGLFFLLRKRTKKK